MGLVCCLALVSESLYRKVFYPRTAPSGSFFPRLTQPLCPSLLRTLPLWRLVSTNFSNRHSSQFLIPACFTRHSIVASILSPLLVLPQFKTELDRNPRLAPCHRGVRCRWGLVVDGAWLCHNARVAPLASWEPRPRPSSARAGRPASAVPPPRVNTCSGHLRAPAGHAGPAAPPAAPPAAGRTS